MLYEGHHIGERYELRENILCQWPSRKAGQWKSLKRFPPSLERQRCTDCPCLAVKIGTRNLVIKHSREIIWLQVFSFPLLYSIGKVRSHIPGRVQMTRKFSGNNSLFHHCQKCSRCWRQLLNEDLMYAIPPLTRL